MGNATHTVRKLAAETRVRATPMPAWQAWAEPERLKDWFMDEAAGEPSPGSEMTLGSSAFGMTAKVRVLQSVPGERFVIEWPGQPGRPQEEPRLWDISVTREGGEAVVRVVSSGFGEGEDWDDEYEGEQDGWPVALASYKYYVENHFGERRREITALRPVRERQADLRPFFTKPDLLYRWLTNKGELGAKGSVYSLELKDGRVWNGEVLVEAGNQCCISVRELDGVAALMSFIGQNGQRMAGVSVSAWKLEEASARELASTLNAALDALARPEN